MNRNQQDNMAKWAKTNGVEVSFSDNASDEIQQAHFYDSRSKQELTVDMLGWSNGAYIVSKVGKSARLIQAYVLSAWLKDARYGTVRA
jgi:predicted nucleotide-binding protein